MSSNWLCLYERAKQYFIENGNLLIPSQYITADGIKLGAWIDHQRGSYMNNKLSHERVCMLENIGMVWSLYDLQWERFYNLAREYYEKNGNLLVSGKHTEDGNNLGAWIGTQRRRYKERKLSKKRISMLESIGMVWSLYDLQWNEYYELLVEYRNTYGTTSVPLSYVTQNKKQLGSWVSHQRRDRKNNKLSAKRVEMLESIGMVWDGVSATWDEMFQIAQLYYRENGNLTISNSRFVYLGASLGSWILTQRRNYANRRLNDKQINMLKEIGMEWNSTNNKDYIWEKNYNTVLEFYKKYNHLYIPIRYVTDDGVRIGVWLYDQGLKYKSGNLVEHRKRKLDLLDKTWLIPINTKSSFPEQAVLFYVKKFFPSATKYRAKGISEIDIYIPELRIGIEYDGPIHKRRIKKDIEKSEACKKQGIILIRIRDCECPIIEDQSVRILLKDDSFDSLANGIKELLKILKITNADIDIKRDYIIISDQYIRAIDLNWYDTYEKLKEYYSKHGNINVPIGYVTPDGFALGHWLSNIRSSAKSPSFQGVRLNSYKIELLDELGMDWSPTKTQWEKTFSLAKQYYFEKGNLMIPDKYETKDGTKLGRWIQTQRYCYKKNRLSPERVALLEEIGMVWKVNEG